MAVGKGYLEFIQQQLSGLDDITYRQMMGEYIVYYRGKIAAYLCDDRFLVKPVPSAVKMLPNARYEPPYDGAKDMILVDNTDSKEFLETLFNAMFDELVYPKRKTK